MTPDLHCPASHGVNTGRTPADRLNQAHRLMFELHRGPIPTGLQIDHLCRQPLCVNPDHLEPVTQRENLRRGRGTKVTADQVELIRSARGRVGVRALARTLGIHYSTVSRIGRYQRWTA